MADVGGVTDADRARARVLWRAARFDDDAVGDGPEGVIAAALAEGRRQLADELAALIGDRLHLGPASLGLLLTRLDRERDRFVVAAEVERGVVRRG